MTLETLHISSNTDADVFVPIPAFSMGVKINPSALGWTVQSAVRDILSSAALVYNANTWEQDQFGVWCAVLQLNLAEARYEYWVKVTTPTEVVEAKSGILIVEGP